MMQHTVALTATALASILGALELVAVDIHRLKEHFKARFICSCCHKLKVD